MGNLLPCSWSVFPNLDLPYCGHAVLRQADFRILLSKKYYKGCLLVRNDFMLSHASQIVACYDGRRCGGTFYTCNRARVMNIPVINLYDHFSGQRVNTVYP